MFIPTQDESWIPGFIAGESSDGPGMTAKVDVANSGRVHGNPISSFRGGPQGRTRNPVLLRQ